MAASRKASPTPPDLPETEPAFEKPAELAGDGAAQPREERSLFKRKKLDPLRGHPILDPFEVEQHLTKGQFASLDLHLLNLRAHRLKAMRHEGITTIAQLRRKIKILPHQVKAAIKVLNNLQGRAILADEVGLGKTIEAGIVMKELVSRGKAKSILILTPASLAGQWQEELWNKFGERFVRHDDEEFRGFSHHDKIVASIDTAKSPQHSRDIIAREWDLVIIDEAHYLKNKKTQRYSLADDITARHALMLTATPIQNNLIELYNLINLIKPGLLGTMQNFEEEYIGDAQGRVLLHAQRLQTLLQQVLIRNRRAETGLKFPERKVETHRIKASKGEYELHQAVSNFIRTYKDFFESHLALMVLEREVASSAPALVKTLNNMSPKVHDPEVAQAMDDLKTLAENIKRNSKVNLILDIAKNTKEKMIVFTQFRETQELLSRRLKQEGVENVKFHGQLTPGRRRNALEEFRGTGKGAPQVLVATDSGSEGLNLQFCHILVNYDLPWNPMRVEQRIGRVHRIGQDSSNVVILNLAVADTIEDYVLQVLYEKIKLFEVAIGEMDLILSDIDESGGLEKRILDIILETKTDKEVKESLDRVHREVKKSKEQAEEIKMLDASVFQQFDLSTAKDDVQIEDSVDLDQEVRQFVQLFLEATGAEAEEASHITTVRMPRTFWKRLGGVHTYTTDPETFEEKDGEVELLSLGSKFVQGSMGLLQEEASVGQVRTAEVDQPTTVLYYRYFIETIRSEIEAFLTVEVHDDGSIESVRQELAELPDGEPVDQPIALTPRQWQDLTEKARFEVGNLLQPILQAKREEAQAEVRRTEKRLEQYYERLKEETRQEEQKIRHKMGKIRNRLWFNENGIRERKLEDEYTQLEEQLHKATFQNNKRVEDLDREMKDRMGREQEKNEPRLTLELIGATRLLPYPAGKVAAVQRAAVAVA
jgi:superfamily II DNA or RNA helicase